MRQVYRLTIMQAGGLMQFAWKAHAGDEDALAICMAANRLSEWLEQPDTECGCCGRLLHYPGGMRLLAIALPAFGIGRTIGFGICDDCGDHPMDEIGTAVIAAIGSVTNGAEEIQIAPVVGHA